MRVIVRKSAAQAETVPIHTEFIKLQDFLKFAGAVETGGEAKLLIQSGQVRVGGETCTQRGRKLRPGDRVSAPGGEFLVGEGGPQDAAGPA